MILAELKILIWLIKLVFSGYNIERPPEIFSHSFISSHVVISGTVKIGEQCFLGVNSTIRDKVSIGCKSVIGAGCLILSDVKPKSVFRGSASQPSKISSEKLAKI